MEQTYKSRKVGKIIDSMRLARQWGKNGKIMLSLTSKFYWIKILASIVGERLARVTFANFKKNYHKNIGEIGWRKVGESHLHQSKNVTGKNGWQTMLTTSWRDLPSPTLRNNLTE